MIDYLSNQQWILIGLAFFGILFYVAWIRWKDRRWIDQRFGQQAIRAISFGVISFGLAKEPGKVKRLSGCLILLTDRLFFRSRNGKVEIDIPGDRIKKVYHDVRHKGEDIHQSLVKVDFVHHNGHRDTAAFKVPYPPQWIQAICLSLNIKNDRTT
jgi:hypothetical protein